MCGIFGFSHSTEITRAMTPLLAWEMELRGKDSWAASSGSKTIKSLGPITESFYDHEDEIAELPRMMVHTRGASVGVVSLQNQHPFEFRCEQNGTWVRTAIGIHNGCIVNHEALNVKYSRSHPVDSMHVYDHIANGLSTEELQGWGNLAWYEYTPEHPEGEFHLARFNNEDLHVAKLFTGEVVFCSLARPIVRAAAMAGSKVEKFFEIINNKRYTIETKVNDNGMIEGMLFITRAEFKFGSREQQYFDWPRRYKPISSSYVNARNYIDVTGNVVLAALQHHERIEGICAVSGCVERVKHNRKLELICEKHFQEVM